MSAPAPTSSMQADDAKIDELIGKVEDIKTEIVKTKAILANDVKNLNNCTGFKKYITNFNSESFYNNQMDNLIILNESLQKDLENAKLTANGISQGTTTPSAIGSTAPFITTGLGMGTMTFAEGLLRGLEDFGDAVCFIFGGDDTVKKRWAHDTINSMYDNIGAKNTFGDSPVGSAVKWLGRATTLGLTIGGGALLAGAVLATSPVSVPILAGVGGLAVGLSGFGSSVEKSLNAGYDRGTATTRGLGAAARNIASLGIGLVSPLGAVPTIVATALTDAGMNAIPTGSPSGQPSGNSSNSQPEPEPNPNPSDETGGDSYPPDPGEDNGNGGGSGWDSSSDSGNYDDYTPTPDTGTTAVTETELASREGLIPVQPTDEAKIEELKPTDNTETTTTDQQNTNGENVITTEQSTNQPANTGENVTTIQDNPGETVVAETRYVQPEGNYQGYSYNENEGVSAPELETTPELDPNAIEDETELLTDIGELEDTTASFEDVIQANEYVKIPTSTTPIQTNPTSSGGNAFIPIAAGLSAAAAAGIGAKAYMDRKHNNDNGEEDDDFSEEWSDDYSDDNSITINENSADNQSESLLEDDYTYTEPEKYGARNNEELADLQ